MRIFKRHLKLKCTEWSVPLMVNAGIPLSFYRYHSTRTPMEQLVIHAAQWDGTNYYHRLGFQNEVHDLGRIKEHYRILAKHYHPDNSHAPPHAKEAFQNINEAYEYATANAKGGVQDTAGENEKSFTGFRFSDQERRLHQMRFLGDGIALFMAMTIIFIFIVARHNRKRLQGRYLMHLLTIFFIIQLFPRLLAAAILFACHSTYLVGLVEAKEQSATSLMVERHGDKLIIRVNGIAEEAKKDIVLQVTVTECVDKDSSVSHSQSDAEGVAKPDMFTTLTFDAGIMTISLPLLKDSMSERLEYRLKGVDSRRGFVLIDREFSVDL